MKIVLDIIYDLGLKDFLLTQEGITDVKILSNGSISEFDITFNGNITPFILYKYIEMFQGNDIPLMLEFDKKSKLSHTTIKYVVDDLCCEFCYKGFITDLFLNNNIFSVKSNFDLDNSLFNVEFYIEYNEKYDEQDLIKYIEDKLNNE